MFTIQTASMSQSLADAGEDDAVIQALSSLLGGCDQPLVHRAPITLQASFPNAPTMLLTPTTNELNINNELTQNPLDLSEINIGGDGGDGDVTGDISNLIDGVGGNTTVTNVNNQYLTQQQINNNTINNNSTVTISNPPSRVIGPTVGNPVIGVIGGLALYVEGATYIENLIYQNIFYSPYGSSGTAFCEKEFDVVTDVDVQASFSNCQLSIAVNVNKTRVRCLVECGSHTENPPPGGDDPTDDPASPPIGDDPMPTDPNGLYDPDEYFTPPEIIQIGF